MTNKVTAIPWLQIGERVCACLGLLYVCLKQFSRRIIEQYWMRFAKRLEQCVTLGSKNVHAEESCKIKLLQ